MKSRRLFPLERIRWCWAPLLGIYLPASGLRAADTSPAPAPSTNSPAASTSATPSKPAPELAAFTPEQLFEGGTNAYSNWIDIGVGGFITTGNKAQFQQGQQSKSAFGGVEDFHYQAEVAKGTTLGVDGRGLFDNDDYKLKLDVTKEKLGFLRFSYNQFRTWYNGDGGFFPPTGTFYSGAGEALELDRGEVTFEGGLTLEHLPKITFKYTHTYREGEKGSTEWGLTHPQPDTLRGLSPSFYDINEHSDSFQLDATHTINTTDFALGLRYETGKLDDALKITQFPGESVQQKITDRQTTTFDLFNVHASTETWLKKNLLLSSGYSFSDLDNDLSGSRVYGSDFDVGYVPGAQNGYGYYGLSGASHMQEYVMDLNLMSKPSPHVTIVPSLRVMKEDSDASVNGMQTLGSFSPTPFSADLNSGVLDVRERLDLDYTGVTNWVYYGRIELTEGNGNLSQNGGLGLVQGIGVPPVQQQTDDNRFFQKYSLGARWYPTRTITFDAGGYYKNNHYGYNNNTDSTPNNGSSFNRYPAYLTMQDFETFDGNTRLTIRPLRNVTLISRYEYQLSTVHTRPDSVSGLPEVESSKMITQIIAQDISWTPWSRLNLQTGFNYVLSDTKTPGSSNVQGLLDAQNNYWTLNFSSGIILDDRTDLTLSYFYYQADNYTDNSSVGVPLGAGGTEHGVTASIVRRISKNIRLSVKYGYYNYSDPLYGGNTDYQAHLLYTSLRYRF